MSAAPATAAPAASWRRWLPGWQTLRSYERSWLSRDVVAGLVLGAMLVPQGMAYAELAGLPAVTGLYTTIACLVAYAIFGPSKVLVLGPDSSLGPMIAAALLPLGATSDPETAIALAGMLAVIVGVIEIGLGIARLGFVADLLAREVQVGYLNGLAITIIVGQLPKLFGFSTDADNFFEEVEQFVRNLDQRNSSALWMGLGVLAVLLVLPRVTRRVPAVLVAMIGATVVSGWLNLAEEKGVSTVGTLPQGFPKPEIPWTGIDDLLPLTVAALGITLVSLADTVATAASFAARRGEEVHPDQEMVGIGTANAAAGVFSGFPISTSSSRTAVAEQAGAKSQMTGIVGASIVLVLLVFLNDLLKDLPQSALAAVVIAAAISLIDIPELVRYRQSRPSALVLSIIASLGVIVLGVLPGIVVAIVLAIFLFFRRNWWPHGAVLGHTEGESWNDLVGRPEGEQVPGVLVYRWEAPLFFANAGSFRREVRHLLAGGEYHAVVLQCEAITDIDITAAEVLEQLERELEADGVVLVYAELRTRLRRQLARYGVLDEDDELRFFRKVNQAVEAVRAAPPRPG